MILLNTPLSSPILEGVGQEGHILVTCEVEVEYQNKAPHEVKQVRGYLGFIKNARFTITWQKYE